MREFEVYTTACVTQWILLNCVRYFLFSIVAVSAGAFQQEVAHTFTTSDGLPSNDVVSVAVANGQVFAKTATGTAKSSRAGWSPAAVQFPTPSSTVTDSRGRVWSLRAGTVECRDGQRTRIYTPAERIAVRRHHLDRRRRRWRDLARHSERSDPFRRRELGVSARPALAAG